MVSLLILVIGVLGTSAFRYSAALNVRQADLRTTAARIAQMLCESWRGTSDPNTFDPTVLTSAELASALEIESDYTSYEVPADFTLLRACRITVNGVDYHAVLLWKDVGVGLRALNIVVAWDPRGSSSDDFWYSSYKSFKLTTYITN